MASAKDLKKKIQSISNTKKITRTMEMVSAAKAKQTQGRVEANTPYSRKLAELLDGLCAGGKLEHPLLEQRDKVENVAVLVISANRGLCGGYNTNVLNRAEKWILAEREAGRGVETSVIGKKGIARFKFRKVDVATKYTNFDDRPTFQQADALAQAYMERFRKGEFDQVWVVSMRYHSAATQKPEITQLLPIIPPAPDPAKGTGPSEGGGAAGGADFIFEPSPEEILRTLLPFAVSQLVYRLLLEAAVSEQIARRLAMKLATDNASELIKLYTRRYNRQRQAGITQQIMEIVAGADALR